MSEEMRNTVQESEETLKKKKKPVTREKIKVWITFGVATVILGIIPCFLLFPIGILFSGICMLMLLFVWLPASLKKVKRCFCPECGEKMPVNKFCTECGAKIDAGAKFCPECGNKL